MKGISLLILTWFSVHVLSAQEFEFQHPRPTSNHVNDVVALDANNWFLFCDAGAIVRTTDRGVTWTTSYPDDSVRSIYEATFVSPTTGFACGLDGLLLKTTDMVQVRGRSNYGPMVHRLRESRYRTGHWYVEYGSTDDRRRGHVASGDGGRRDDAV